MARSFQVALNAEKLVVFTPALGQDNAGDWRALLAKLVAAGFKDIVLDASAMPYVDSLGLAEMVRCYTVCSRSSGSLSLNRISNPTRHLLDVTRLLTIFTVLDEDYSHLRRVEVSVDDLSPLLNDRT